MTYRAKKNMPTLASYREARDFCPGSLTVSSGNVRIFRDKENVVVRLHNTDILTYRPDNTVKLDTGGWYSVTTKSWMNKILPLWIRIFTHDWHTSIEVRDDPVEFELGVAVIAL